MHSRQFIVILLLTVIAAPAWASSGDKSRGDWHIHNETETQVIVDIAKADGSNCFSSYIDPDHTLGLPADLHDCPYPITLAVKVMQADQEGSCKVTLPAMQDVTFNGETCE